MMKWEYADPMEVAARRERERQRMTAECGACVHHVSIIWHGEMLDACEKRSRTFGRQRCTWFKERECPTT